MAGQSAPPFYLTVSFQKISIILLNGFNLVYLSFPSFIPLNTTTFHSDEYPGWPAHSILCHLAIGIDLFQKQQSDSGMSIMKYNGNPIQSNPIQSNPIQSNPIQSNPIQSNPIQSNPINFFLFNFSILIQFIVNRFIHAILLIIGIKLTIFFSHCGLSIFFFLNGD